MIKFIIRRLIQTIPVLIGVSIVVFGLMFLIPGDPAQIIAGESASQQQIEQMRERLGLNDPIPVQYWNFISNAVQGDLGSSIRSGRDVTSEIMLRFWTTVELALYSTILSVFLGLIAGVISATRHNTYIDSGIMLVALLGLSMPNFWLGLMLIKYFAVDFGMFSASGWGEFRQMVLPVITLGTSGAAVIARMTRSSMLEVIGQDYIRTARAKGVKEQIVIYRHALKNALIPVVTVVGLSFGSLLGGTVITEQVFAINGMGRLMIDAILARDFPIVQGTVLVVSLLFVLVNLLVDIAYRMLNKRIDLD
ncbi:glutathione ABC transporter permease [Alkalihalobacillus alcalophilus ATCC 27647 = CGMCC 1.3604]|uniref:Nickel import system permease protein NikB n=1 Tax=Alkalihalobacillus alcalophilus ATCC 27647 = CGMCC 1.3604 TaxID=1218173 RepID=A0A094XBF5_ALKAL|nr:nickel ABC transporter permease [Alkalihalobacillus alcalophilus]KGA96140.1 peptide ABC transporter permease [Alkalihalobacillus alcalophilus ATCC 27647 = CGMCC 1.3604]MED1560371.1 ABC transporter permease [Alkalihalobacillus alcalophilus]THG90402.1 glutathione ABC transporter permease [Alkalihalobacillus alcalophilus ATCC 27647 = CGMCC 1.3604]